MGVKGLEFYSGKRVFITGHTGFKGSWLTMILKNAGAAVTGLSLEPPTEPSLFETAGTGNDMESYICDIRDYEKLSGIFASARPEIVFHLAAQPIVRTSYAEPRLTYETNVMGTVNILECVRNSDTVRSFLNVTTDKVYLNNDLNIAFSEDMQLDGYDPYSNSKSCSELATHSYRKSFFSGDPEAPGISTARAGNVIGGGDFAKDRIIPDCVRAAMAHEDIIIRNPSSTRPFQHVLEPLFAYLMIAEKQYMDRKYAGWYNVGPETEDCVTAGTIADMFVKYWGEGLRWVDRSDGGPHEASFLRLDCTKLKEVFGWRPSWHIEKAIEETVRWSRLYAEKADAAAIRDEMEKEIKEFADNVRRND